MSQNVLDFSTFFKVESLFNNDIYLSKFCEIGSKRITAIVTEDGKFHLHYINPQMEKMVKTIDFVFQEKIDCICFDSSASWVFALCKSLMYVIPCLPYLEPNSEYDKKWSLSSVTMIQLEIKMQPLCVVLWLTENAENLMIIGQKNGIITFYSLDLSVVIAETSIPEPVINIQISTDNSLDKIELIITGQEEHYKLCLEDRSANYSWIQACQQKLLTPAAQPSSSVLPTSPSPMPKNPSLIREKSNFFTYIKQISTDKIAMFSQKKSQSQESEEPAPKTEPTYALEPRIKEMPTSKWSTSVQFVDGSHVVTHLDRECTVVVVELVGEESSKYKLAPTVKEHSYDEALWSPKLIYLIQNCVLEIHSSYYSNIPVTAKAEAVRSQETLIWRKEFSSKILSIHLVSPKIVSTTLKGWKEPTFICDLNLPRFNLEPCIVVHKDGISMISTNCDPCEFLVRGIMGGGQGCERGARALGAPLPPLLRAAADLTLARNNLVPAKYLYHLSKSEADGWTARLGVFGKLKEVAEFKPKKQDNSIDLNFAAIFMQTLAALNKKILDPDEKIDVFV